MKRCKREQKRRRRCPTNQKVWDLADYEHKEDRHYTDRVLADRVKQEHPSQAIQRVFSVEQYTSLSNLILIDRSMTQRARYSPLPCCWLGYCCPLGRGAFFLARRGGTGGVLLLLIAQAFTELWKRWIVSASKSCRFLSNCIHFAGKSMIFPASLRSLVYKQY